MHKFILALGVLSVAVGCGSSAGAGTTAKSKSSKVHESDAGTHDAAAETNDDGASKGSKTSDAASSTNTKDSGSSSSSHGGAGGSAGQSNGGAGAASTGDAGSSAHRAPITLAELPDAFGASVCEALTACVGPSVVRELTEREECMVRVAAELRATEFAYIDQAVSSGHVIYDPSQLPACVDAIHALGCDVLSHTLPKECSAVLAGQVELGGECMIGAECAGAAFCAGSDACPSHCAALLAEGDACSGDNQCGDDLQCAGGSCLRPSLDGEPCNGQSGKLCRIGFSCEGSTDVDTGHCVLNAMVQVGDAGDSCEPGGALCKDGLSCVYAGNSAFHCEAAVGSGASCHLGLPGQCPNGEYCDTTDVTAQSVCMALPGEGKACVLAGLCAPGLVCVADGDARTCKAIEDNCGACTSDVMCRSGHCDQGKCAPPSACGATFACP